MEIFHFILPFGQYLSFLMSYSPLPSETQDPFVEITQSYNHFALLRVKRSCGGVGPYFA